MWVERCVEQVRGVGWGLARRVRALARDESGQGTTEYAILVGVLVVIAIVAIVAFRDSVEDLWTAIEEGINGL